MLETWLVLFGSLEPEASLSEPQGEGEVVATPAPEVRVVIKGTRAP